jgi:hypothetical protein
MPPKPQLKKPAVTKPIVVEEPPPAGYDPSTHQKFMKASDWFHKLSDSEIVSRAAVLSSLDGVAKHIQAKKLLSLVVPYTIETGLSVTLEPSLLFNFTQDDYGFHIDTEFERDEPPRHPKDCACGDKSKGPERLAKRYLYPPERADSRCSSSKKS